MLCPKWKLSIILSVVTNIFTAAEIWNLIDDG